MLDHNMEKRVSDCIAEILNVEEINIDADQDIAQLGMDSLKFIQLIVKIEAEFNISFDDDLVFENLNTIRKLVNAVSEKVK